MLRRASGGAESWSAGRYFDRCAGFSLVEALIALAIVAMLATALTRFVANTRANAASVGEMMEMAALVDTLLAEIPANTPIKPGRIQGTNSGLAWSIDVSPVPFNSYPLHVFDRRSVKDLVGTTAAAADSSPPVETELFRVAATVRARSGRRYIVDTVRMGSGP
jgi:prepilin-type N-terminal cleavage/methylation domain-containing protein